MRFTVQLMLLAVSSTSIAHPIFVTTSHTPNSIDIVNSDSSAIENVYSTSDNVLFRQAVFSEGKLYWTEQYNQRIYSSSLDGSDVNVIVDASSYNQATKPLEIIGEKLYWGDQFNSIYSCSLDGSNQETLLTVSERIMDIEKWGNHLLLSTYDEAGGSPYEFRTYLMDQSGSSSLVFSGQMMNAMVIHKDELFFMDNYEQSLFKVGLDFADVEKVADLPQSEYGIRNFVSDGDWLYFGDRNESGGNGIFRIKDDGSLIEGVYVDDGTNIDPQYIVAIPEPNAIALVAIFGGGLWFARRRRCR